MLKFVLVLVTMTVLAVSIFVIDDQLAVAKSVQASQDTTPTFTWAKNWGGSSDVKANNAVVDKAGNLYVVGEFAGTVNFDPTGLNPNATKTSYNGTKDAYVTKFDPSGNFI